MTNNVAVSVGKKPPKFSDLNAYFQGLQTRLSLTFGALALLLATLGFVGTLIPKAPAGSPQILGTLAVVSIVLGFITAAGTLVPRSRFTYLLEHRLQTRDLENPDDVSPELQAAFLQEIRHRHKTLNRAYGLFTFTALCCLGHFIAILYTDGKSNAPNDVCVNYNILNLPVLNLSDLSNEACTFALWNIFFAIIVFAVIVLFSAGWWFVGFRARRNIARNG